MPQTMCQLCHDKVNDFYEYRQMCVATNEQTRKFLQLPEIRKKKSPTNVFDSAESILGDEDVDTKIGVKSTATKKGKKGIAQATTSKKAARAGGKIKREIIANGSDGVSYSISLSDDDDNGGEDWAPNQRKRKKKGNASLLLAPKELNQRERQREFEQKKNETEQKKKNK